MKDNLVERGLGCLRRMLSTGSVGAVPGAVDYVALLTSLSSADFCQLYDDQ